MHARTHRSVRRTRRLREAGIVLDSWFPPSLLQRTKASEGVEKTVCQEAGEHVSPRRGRQEKQ